MKKIINGIKNIKKTPQNGYLIFSSKELFKIIEPPLPIKQNYYKCDNKFHIDNFSYLFEIHNKYLILMISSKNCYIYLNNGTNLKSLYHHDIDIPSSSRRGGQSALRYDRIREEKIKLLSNLIIENLKLLTTYSNKIVSFGYSDFNDDLIKNLKMERIEIIKEYITNKDISIDCAKNDIDNAIFEYENKKIYDKINKVTEDIQLNPDKYLFGINEVLEYDSNYMVKSIICTKDLQKDFNCKNIIVCPINALKIYGDIIGELYHVKSY